MFDSGLGAMRSIAYVAYPLMRLLTVISSAMAFKIQQLQERLLSEEHIMIDAKYKKINNNKLKNKQT